MERFAILAVALCLLLGATADGATIEVDFYKTQPTVALDVCFWCPLVPTPLEKDPIPAEEPSVVVESDKEASVAARPRRFGWWRRNR